MSRLRRWLLGNLGLKLIALGIAVLLWTTYTAEPVAEVGFQVPLEFHNMPRDLEISGDVPAQIYVRVRGRSALLRRLSPADLGVRVDLAGKVAGDLTVQFDPDQVDSPYGATVVKISPAQLRLRLVQRRAASP